MISVGGSMVFGSTQKTIAQRDDRHLVAVREGAASTRIIELARP